MEEQQLLHCLNPKLAGDEVQSKRKKFRSNATMKNTGIYSYPSFTDITLYRIHQSELVSLSVNTLNHIKVKN